MPVWNMTNETMRPAGGGVSTRPEFCVLRSPLDAHCVVARPGEQGTAGWQTLYGPDSADNCWAWIHSRPREGLRF